jgi:hypothetical protein
MPGFPFPPAGPLDLGSPPSLVLRVAKTSPSALLDFASVLPRSSIPRCGSLFARSTLEPRVSCAWWTGYRAPPLRPVLPRRRRDLSSFPCFPLTACPGSQPRWIPIGTCRSPLGLLPSRPLALSALPEPPRTRFRGLFPAACSLVFPLLCTPCCHGALRFPSVPPTGLWTGGLSDSRRLPRGSFR